MTAREPLDAGRIFAPDERSLAVMLEAQARNFGAKPLVPATVAVMGAYGSLFALK